MLPSQTSPLQSTSPHHSLTNITSFHIPSSSHITTSLQQAPIPDLQPESLRLRRRQHPLHRPPPQPPNMHRPHRNNGHVSRRPPRLPLCTRPARLSRHMLLCNGHPQRHTRSRRRRQSEARQRHQGGTGHGSAPAIEAHGCMRVLTPSRSSAKWTTMCRRPAATSSVRPCMKQALYSRSMSQRGHSTHSSATSLVKGATTPPSRVSASRC
jgi:hypothetical protein